ncbi:MAG: FecR family protein [Cyclobacteriaceae bacterium]
MNWIVLFAPLWYLVVIRSKKLDKQQIIRLLEKYQHGACTHDEKKLVEEFFTTYQSGNEEWIDWKHGDQKEVSDRIYRGIQKNIYDQSSIVRRNIYKYAAALLIIFISSILVFQYNQEAKEIEVQNSQFITKTTQRGQKTNIVLGDGTFIRLNSESSLVYPSRFKKDLREVTLIGEAYFEVTKDSLRPFVIKSQDLVTRVLGTSFNIKAYPDTDMEVTVSSGKVQVLSSNDEVLNGLNQHVYLTANQQVSYNLLTNELIKKEVEINQYLAWKNDQIILNKVSMKEASSILERWFNVEIIFENKMIENCIIRSEYKNENLINILESMKFILGIDYRLEENNQIIISGESCKDT